ncbi:MAG: alpha/beta hydrolase [Solirubrobacterales bacterium]|nr:alpha/beta hydrolase [Solirubrobacterales bacterium]
MQLNHHRGGTGEPLVLIHGIGSHWQVWEPVLKALEREREVLAVDLPGFGDSPAPDRGMPPGIASQTRLLLEFLEDVGLQSPHVAGNSMGGWIALELAKLGRVKSATALSPAGFWSPAEAIYSRSTLWASVRLARLLEPRAEKLLASPAGRKALFGQVLAHPERMPPAAGVASIQAAARAAWFDETLIAITSDEFRDGQQIGVPTTIGWGDRDHLLLPRQARRAFDQIPRAHVLTLWDCGHLPTYDDPQQTARLLLNGSSG